LKKKVVDQVNLDANADSKQSLNYIDTDEERRVPKKDL